MSVCKSPVDFVKSLLELAVLLTQESWSGRRLLVHGPHFEKPCSVYLPFAFHGKHLQDLPHFSILYLKNLLSTTGNFAKWLCLFAGKFVLLVINNFVGLMMYTLPKYCWSYFSSVLLFPGMGHSSSCDLNWGDGISGYVCLVPDGETCHFLHLFFLLFSDGLEQVPIVVMRSNFAVSIGAREKEILTSKTGVSSINKGSSGQEQSASTIPPTVHKNGTSSKLHLHCIHGCWSNSVCTQPN